VSESDDCEPPQALNAVGLSSETVVFAAARDQNQSAGTEQECGGGFGDGGLNEGNVVDGEVVSGGADGGEAQLEDGGGGGAGVPTHGEILPGSRVGGEREGVALLHAVDGEIQDGGRLIFHLQRPGGECVGGVAGDGNGFPPEGDAGGGAAVDDHHQAGAGGVISHDIEGAGLVARIGGDGVFVVPDAVAGVNDVIGAEAGVAGGEAGIDDEVLRRSAATGRQARETK
jgi:hypothetical protein